VANILHFDVSLLLLNINVWVRE